VKLSAVEQTQQQIVDIIRRLQDSGELVINNNAEEEEMIT
jgi:flagellar motor switch protein FliG